MEESRLSRAELLSGGLNRSRRAGKLVSAIEGRCSYMRDESRRVVAAYLVGGGEFERVFGADYLRAVKLTATGGEELTLGQIERFASQWNGLVPPDPELRARILHLLHHKYGLGPHTRAALCANDPAVQVEYARLFGDVQESQVDSVAAGRRAAEREASRGESWEDVEARLDWLNVPGGETLYRAGDPGDALYVIISGRVRATVPGDDGQERVVGELARGELLGEMEVLTGDTRAATIRATRDTELVRLCRKELLALAQKHFEVLLQINALTARRVREQDAEGRRARNTLHTYALLPCDAGTPLGDFGPALASLLDRLGPTRYVVANDVASAIEAGAEQAGPGDPRNAQIASWLNELEARYRYVVYEARPDFSEWSRRCLRQADHVILVGRAAGTPEPQPHEVALLAADALTEAAGDGVAGQPARKARRAALASRVVLVLLHDPETEAPFGTSRWLALRTVRSHHHVRLGNTADTAYFARCLAGKAVGLVLGGGGARGLAHVGVCRALAEAGLPVDMVGGTSMGALLTGLTALGLDWRQQRKLIAEVASPLKLFDPTLPVVSLFASRKVTGILQRLYGDVSLEDLWRPAFCVSSNLSRSSETVFRQGPLWKAARASMAIPGIFSPVLHEDDVHVDGAVINNLPIDVMCELGQAGTVIAVNVMPLEDMGKAYRFGDSLSGLQAALGALVPGGPTAPVIYETLVRVMALHEVHSEEAKRRLCDIYITPPVERYNILDFGSYDAIIEAGYGAALDALAAWRGDPAPQPPARTLPAASPSPPTANVAPPLRQLSTAIENLEKLLADWQ